MVGRTLIKNRRHELLVKNFGETCLAKGISASTAHPIDLVLRLSSETVLVEAKVLYKGDATTAVRDAVGQLFDYRYHLYDRSEDPKLLGLFSESIGQDFVEFLQSLSIASIWWSHEGWQCSPLAAEWGQKFLARATSMFSRFDGCAVTSTIESSAQESRDFWIRAVDECSLHRPSHQRAVGVSY